MSPPNLRRQRVQAAGATGDDQSVEMERQLGDRLLGLTQCRQSGYLIRAWVLFEHWRS